MSMNKITDIKLETTATYQPLSDLNVRFWSQDKNTAELRFIITRNQFPLSLSKENVKVIIALESGSSFISSDDFIIDSEVEGVARYIIPTDFMRVASNVTGQVYVTTLDKEEIIVERQFKFTVSNDLLNDYPSEDKLRYIKTFDDLRNEIASRVSKLESDMETMEDYVVQVQDTTQKGLAALNDLISKKLKEYNDNHADKLALINTAVDGYVQDFLDQRSYIDTKYAEFQTAVGRSGLVTVGDAENWQKYKLTMDNGNYPITPVEDLAALQALEPGYYYTTGTPSPSGMSTSGFTHVEFRDTLDVKRITFRPYNTNQEAVMTYYSTTGWTEWKNKMDGLETTIGSQNKANTAENNAKVYTDSKYNSRNTVIFEGAANGVGTVMNLSETLDNFIVLYVYGSYPGGDFVVTSDPSGSSRITVSNTNLIDTGGNGGGIYELGIEKTSRTKLTISNDVYFDLSTQEGSGADANKYKINKIVGVRK